jgi:hypothetical protein
MARWVVLAVLVVGVLARGSFAREPTAAADRGGLTSEQRRGGFTYDASVDPASRAAIEGAIAEARPEARSLIDAVDGATVVKVGQPPLPGALGSTQGVGDHYEVVLNLGETQRDVGGRGVTRLVLHELGHVVDHALVPRALARKLDGEIPAGAPCPEGTPLGSCAPREERFAETFAKWAMGNDLGANLYIGYAVPPPSVSFEAWAAPLSALAA